ncbi:hypothetical protein MYX07_05195 [Patescibacteria group bacterium AH-259-L07]|nr:hypothetical protein [Patescibacteria group bacterium AH-259-L07]
MSEIENKTKYLVKDLKRILIISIVIAIVVVILSIVNARTNLLLDLTNLIMEKF